jgi:hypothetical protein
VQAQRFVRSVTCSIVRRQLLRSRVHCDQQPVRQMRRLKISRCLRFPLRTMEGYHIRKLFILITVVLVAHHYSDFTVLSLSPSLTVLAGSGIKQTSLLVTIDPLKKLRGVGNHVWGRAKRIQVGTSSVFAGSLICTSKKISFALYASEQDQSDLLKWENMYREGRYGKRKFNRKPMCCSLCFILVLFVFCYMSIGLSMITTRMEWTWHLLQHQKCAL